MRWKLVSKGRQKREFCRWVDFTLKISGIKKQGSINCCNIIVVIILNRIGHFSLKSYNQIQKSAENANTRSLRKQQSEIS